eukprot:UN23481
MYSKSRRRSRLSLYFFILIVGLLAALWGVQAYNDVYYENEFTRRMLSGGEVKCDNDFEDIVPLAILLYGLGLLITFYGIGSITDDWFVPSLGLISAKLNLSEDVAGATFMASGSSAPELFTSIVDTFYYQSSVGVGTIVGSAVFNILVIIACSGIGCDDPLTIDWRPLTRDCTFYSIAILEMVY